MNIYSEVEKILDAMEYAVLHGWDSLPHRLRSDLDIALNPRHLGTLEESLLNYRGGRLVQMIQHESSCFYFIMALRDGKGIDFLQVDAATDYRRNGIIYFRADELSKDRARWNGFRVASPETELAYLLVKKTLKGSTPVHQQERLMHLIDKIGQDKAMLISTRLFGKKSGPYVVTRISKNDWKAVEYDTPGLRRALVWEVLKKDPLNPVKYWLDEAKRILVRWRFPTGMSVAVLGPDGAGKSTLIDNIEKRFSGAFRRTAKFHLRPGLIGGKSRGKPVTDPHGKPPRNLFMSFLKLGYYTADYTLGYFYKLYPRFVRSTLVLFDRYYDDLLVDPLRYRYGGPSRLAALAHTFIPPADLLFVLDAKEGELLKRKEEIEGEELRRQRGRYRDMALRTPNAYMLDAHRPPEEVTVEAGEIIMDYLHDRYKSRRDVWFGGGEMQRTLDWLTSVLSTDSEKARFSMDGEVYGDGLSKWETLYEFKCLPVGNGRGYLLPSQPETAVNGLDLYNAQNGKARAVKALLANGLTSGASRLLLKTVKLVVDNGVQTEDRSDILLSDHLKEVIQQNNLHLSLSFGTPGICRKPVIQISSCEGDVLGYVKIGWSELTNSLVMNEARAIRKLSAVSDGSFRTPTVLFTGWWHGRYLVIESPPEGKLKPAPGTLTPQYVAAVCGLTDMNVSCARLRESGYWRDILKRVKDVENGYYRAVLERNGIPRAEEALGGVLLPFHISHGDFAPWNAYLAGGKLFLYDWENSRDDRPPGWDLFHFIFQTNFFLNKRNPAELADAVLKDSYNDLTKEYWEKIGVGKNVRKALFLLYVIDRLSFAASEGRAGFKELGQLSKMVILLSGDR
ncbi:MAG: hypothetical protein AB1598_06590 [Thermodesulfobacteriota bacterium]